LFTSLGGGSESPAPLGALAPHDELARAVDWGLAMRLGQRMSGGLAGPLQRSRLHEDDKFLSLHLDVQDAGLYGDTVERRHSALALRLGRKAKLVTGSN
jgi:exopolyphosphatase/guanosine-5'-triphosphate,3'-diphosphate pyrophosphatase